MATGYLSLKLTAESSKALADAFAFADHSKVLCHHMTLSFGSHELSALPPAFTGSNPGDSFTLKVLGFARSDSIGAVAVGLVRPDNSVVTAGISSNDIPHVTVSLVPGLATPVQSNALLAAGYQEITDGLVLNLTLEVVEFAKK